MGVASERGWHHLICTFKCLYVLLFVYALWHVLTLARRLVVFLSENGEVDVALGVGLEVFEETVGA